MLVAAAYECRSDTATILTTDTFDSSRMNRIAPAEIAGAFLITQSDFLRRLLGTIELTTQQWGLALLTPLPLLAARELGKWIVRRTEGVPGVAAA